MSLTERQQSILDRLQQCGQLTTEQLVQEFGVTPQTVRRDINELCERALARRHHGGLTLMDGRQNLSYRNRQILHSAPKQQLAALAASQLQPGMTLFLGYGTTVACLAQALPEGLPLRVVTNNLQAIAILQEKPWIETWLAGGRLRHGDQDLMSYQTLQFFHQFRADVAICGVAGIDADGQLYEFQPDEAELTRTLWQQSRTHWLLADHSKYQRHAPAWIGSLADVDSLFSDALGGSLQMLCEQHGVSLHLAPSVEVVGECAGWM